MYIDIYDIWYICKSIRYACLWLLLLCLVNMCDDYDDMHPLPHTHTTHFFSAFSQRVLPHPSRLICPASSDIQIVGWLCSVFPIERTLATGVRLIFAPDMLLKFGNDSCLKHVDLINTVWYSNDPHTTIIFLHIRWKPKRRVWGNTNFEATNSNPNFLPQSAYLGFAVC